MHYFIIRHKNVAQEIDEILIYSPEYLSKYSDLLWI